MGSRRRWGWPGKSTLVEPGVTRGYLNRPEQTAERFADPFTGEANARMYKSGDVGRYLPDGNIEFLGRNDFQVKIRGFRIELGEIEARLIEHPAVQDARVVVTELGESDRRLIAYLVPSRQRAFVVSQLLQMEKAGQEPEAQRFELPNGLTVFHQNQSETEFVYQEIFEDEVYLKHGVTLRDGTVSLTLGPISACSRFSPEGSARMRSFMLSADPTGFSFTATQHGALWLECETLQLWFGRCAGRKKLSLSIRTPASSPAASRPPEEARGLVKSFLLNQQKKTPTGTRREMKRSWTSWRKRGWKPSSTDVS